MLIRPIFSTLDAVGGADYLPPPKSRPNNP
jgi:hypothetical protein